MNDESKENLQLSQTNLTFESAQDSSQEKNILTGFHRVDFSNINLANHRRLKFIDGFKGV